MEEMLLSEMKESEVERNARIMKYISQDENALREVLGALESSDLIKNRDSEVLRNMGKLLEEGKLGNDEVVVLLAEIGGRTPEFLAFIVAFAVYKYGC